MGKQVVYSMYYLHFGHFGGFAVKLIYTILGLALTVVSVTGINIWLARRRHRDALNDLWRGSYGDSRWRWLRPRCRTSR